MERLNLNLLAEDRARLRRLAGRAKRREGEYARELLISAIERLEGEQFAAALASSRTPERKARDAQIGRAMERLRGPAR